MTAALLALLCAHAVGDFLFQTGWMVDHKHNGWVLVLHVAVVTLLSAAFLGGLPWLVLGVVFVTHLGMDALKVHGLGNDLRAFSMDQALHLVVMPALAAMVPSAAANGIWSEWLSSPERLLFLQAQVVLIALIVGLRVGGIVIGLMMNPFVCQLDDQEGIEQGLTGAGRRIGVIERALVIILMLSGHGGGVGFVIAAKSILRFGEIREAKHRKLAEYILIGTFASFAWALAVSVLAQTVLDALSDGGAHLQLQHQAKEPESCVRQL